MARKAGLINEIDRHIAQRIQLRRVMLGMSQSDLAARCGLSFQQIQKYETAGNRIPSARLFDLSQALGTPVSFFFNGLPGNMPDETRTTRSMHVHQPDSDDPLLRTESLQLIRLYWKLETDAQRTAFLNMLKSMVGTAE